MATAGELTYQGNAALGAGTSGSNIVLGEWQNARTIDAVDRFAAFSMQRNRDQWVQSNIELQRQAAEAAKNLPVTYGDLIPEDKGIVDEKVRNMYDFYSKNPTAVKYTIDPKTGKNNADQYNEFMRLKAELDHTIVRGNNRALQLGAMQETMKTITDPVRARQMEAAIMKERQKPITENLVIPPNITPFNLAKAANDWSAQGARQYEFVQRFPNDVLTVTKNLFDPFAASQAPISQLYAPGNEDMKRSIAETQNIMNEIIKKHTRTENGRSILDVKAMQSDADAQPLLEQVNLFNQHVRAMNTTETVENGQTTKKRVREFLGYSEDLPEISIADGVSAQDVIRMAMTYKLGIKTDVKYQNTNQELTRYNIDVDARQRAADRAQRDRQFWAEYNKGNEEKEAVADEKIGVFYNTFNTPWAGGTFDKNVGGWEVGLTAPLVEALKIPTNKREETVKDKTADPLGGTATDETGTKFTTQAIFPKSAHVISPAGKGINEQTLRVQYEDGTVRNYSTLQFFSALNGMHGDDEKVKAAVSAASMKRLKQFGLTQPDLLQLDKRFGTIPQSGNAGGGGSAPADEPSTVPPASTRRRGAGNNQGKLPRPY